MMSFEALGANRWVARVAANQIVANLISAHAALLNALVDILTGALVISESQSQRTAATVRSFEVPAIVRAKFSVLNAFISVAASRVIR